MEGSGGSARGTIKLPVLDQKRLVRMRPNQHVSDDEAFFSFSSVSLKGPSHLGRVVVFVTIVAYCVL